MVDATGVGRAVVDHLRACGLDPVAVSITGGRKTTFESGTWRVPKRELVRALATAIESGRLRVAKSIPDAPAFLREARDFAVTVSDRGHARFAGKTAHDDLVIAAALAVWWNRRRALVARLPLFSPYISCLPSVSEFALGQDAATAPPGYGCIVHKYIVS